MTADQTSIPWSPIKMKTSLFDAVHLTTALSGAAIGLFVAQQMGYDPATSAAVGALAGYGLCYLDMLSSSRYQKEASFLVKYAPVLGGASLLYVYPIAGLTSSMSSLAGAALGYAFLYSMSGVVY